MSLARGKLGIWVKMEPKLFVAGKAFIVHEGKVLVIRESPKYKEGTQVGKYDVIGGRLKPGENFTESLIREIKEENGLDVKIGNPFAVNEWRPTVNGEPWQIIATFFECTTSNQDVQVKLSDDHDHFKWISPKDYKDHNVIENIHHVFESFNK